MKVGTISPSWEDMSPYVVHFTKGDDAPSRSMQIASSGELRADQRFGIGKAYSACPKSVCLSEIPLHQISRLAQHRSSYGFGFRKDFVIDNGGGPILYAYRGTPHAQAARAVMEQNSGDPSHPIWTIAPFIDSPGEYETGNYFFEWEREWRVPGGLQFDPDDVALFILPESIHDSAHSFFNDVEKELLGPVYWCPLIDPYWSPDQIWDALRRH